MSKEKIKKVIIILANPPTQFDKRGQLVSQLSNVFYDSLQRNNIEVDFIDLYKENFNPVHNPEKRDTQTIEYQIRIRKADMIAIFHPVWWGSVPAILKGFCDKVFIAGYAYQPKKGLNIGSLNKKILVVATGKTSNTQMKLLYNNILEIFWKRIIFDTCGLHGEVMYLGEYRKAEEKKVSWWFEKIRQKAENINDSGKIFDLL